MPELIDALRSHTRGLELRETHISWVLLGSELVWKLKKPKNLGFLDFRTLQQREAACQAELHLNRRLAPDSYLDVVPILEEGGEYRFGLPTEAADKHVVDWAVKMRRLPDARRADVLLARGELSSDDIRRIAVTLADFHAGCESDGRISDFGSVESILGNVQENFEQGRTLALNYVSRQQESEIEDRQLSFLSANEALFRRRAATGRVRDGHGDLRLEHAYFVEGQPQIIDCIEFNERFRYADVCADLAFLFMDLNHSGRADLAEALLAAYVQASGDFELYQLVDFYESYRAYVRAKVLSLLAADETADEAARGRAGDQARRYYLHALAAQRPTLDRPVIVAVSGIIGSGKSTAAARVVAIKNIPAVDSDRTRKQLLGTPVTQPLDDDAYTEEMTERVYDEVFQRAGCVLDSGRGVVLDMSFRSRASRQRARKFAKQRGVPFLLIECEVSRDVAIARLRKRTEAPSVSDGREGLYDRFVANFERIDELPANEHLRLNTELSDQAQMELLRARLG